MPSDITTGASSTAMEDSMSRKDLKSGISGSGMYYNSMDYTNHNFEKYSCNSKVSDDVEKCSGDPIKTCKRRYLMLFLASFISMMNGVPQFQYTVVADIISCFYGVDMILVDWTCMVYMIIFLPLVLPVMYFMDKKGLRNTVLVGGFLNLLGLYSFIEFIGLIQSAFS